LGQGRRRAEGIPVLMAKCEAALRAHLPSTQVDRIMALAGEPERLDALPVDQFMNLYRV
jgi:2-methylcitrate dehydratase